MRQLLIWALALLLSGCVSVEKVTTGHRAVGERMNVQIEGPWNNVSLPNGGPAQTWTMEGLPVDQLLLYASIQDGQLVHAEGPAAAGSKVKSFSFRSTMQPDEIVSMFEGMLTRDGSRFSLAKLEPTNFGGIKGFRFSFQLQRKSTNLNLNGVGYAAVSRGELFSIIYLAPRAAFYDRHIATVEKISASARIKE